MRNKYLRIGLPVGLVAVIAGVLLGVFLPGGEDAPGTPSGSETAAIGEAGQAGSGAETGEAAGDGTAPGATDGAIDGEGAAGQAASSTDAGYEAGPGAAADGRASDAARGEASTAAANGETEGSAAGSGQQTASVSGEAGDQAGAPAADASGRAKPSFDVVRIDPKGGSVMAGRAEPGAEVVIRDGEREIGRATANRRGEWVFTDDKPMPPGDRQLSLKDAAPDGPESDQVVVVSVPESAEGEASAQEQTLAVLQPREGGPSVILQLPERTGAGAGGKPGTSVDSLDYTPEGDITVSGQAEPGARLNIYVDNKPVGTAVANEEGRWRAELGSEIAEGQHQLRVDSVDQSGKVVARAETAIAKAPPTMLKLAGETLVIVQPGNSLWRIARRTYGGGVHYSEIFQANRDQIRDPDLIYPGQIFSVPPLG